LVAEKESVAARAMPGKQKRDKTEKSLTRLQSKIAGNVLRPHFDPSLGERQWDESAKQQLVQAVNAAFAAGGHDAVYTQRKLEDWVSNGIYRWRKALQKEKLPPSWKNRAMAGGAALPAPAAAAAPAAVAAPAAAAAAAATAQPPVRKRERVLSGNMTMKPLEKVGKAADPSGAPTCVWRAALLAE
jgi:hypothetical protein